MPSLDDIVLVNITLESAAITEAGFGVPLILDKHTKFAALAKSYTSLTAMVTDGFGVTDAAYVAAGAIFSQSPRVESLVVGKRTSSTTQRWEIYVLTVSNLTVYSGTLGLLGTTLEPWTFTSDASATAAEIRAGIVAAINALAGIANFTATDQTTHVRVDADAVDTHLVLTSLTSNLGSLLNTPNVAIVADYTAVEAYCATAGLDYYAVMSTSRGVPEIVALAPQIEAERKLLCIATQDYDIPTAVTTDIASVLQLANRFRTALIYNRAGSGIYDFADGAFLGKNLPSLPGSETWKFKTLVGITSDGLSDSEFTFIKNKNANYYTVFAGIAITGEGKVAKGDFIDTVRFIDFVHARMQERIFARLAAVKKVPFTDLGVAIIENEVRGVLALGVSQGGFAADPAPTVTVPLVKNVSLVDKSNRFLPDVKFSATLAGAIHSMRIDGTVSV